MTVNPTLVPQRKLGSGALMPAIGLGTFGSDRFGADEVAAAVAGAFEVGYRHFDCASVYENEAQIGEVLEGLPRDEIWSLRSCGTTGMRRPTSWPPAGSRLLIFAWATSTCTWCTGLSPISTRRVSMSLPAARTPGLTSMKTSWRRGGRWRAWSTWA